MPEYPLLKGPKGHQVLGWTPAEGAPSKFFPEWGKAKAKDREKVIEIAKEYAKTGKFPEHDKKFKQIENEDYLCEIKGHQLRMIGFFNGLKFIIVHCVIKKQDKHKREDLKKANKLMEMYYAQA